MKFVLIFMSMFFSGDILAIDFKAAIESALQAECSDSKSYEKGFNEAREDKPMNSDYVAKCSPGVRAKATDSYQRGYKEGVAARPVESRETGREKQKDAQVVIQIGELPNTSPKCSDLKTSTGDQSCFMAFNSSKDRGRCEVCKEGKTCFMALDDGLDRQLCAAYKDKKSCFMAVSDKTERAWCEHLKEGKSCTVVFSDDKNRSDCLKGIVPAAHYYWLN